MTDPAQWRDKILDIINRADEAAKATVGLADDKYIAHQGELIKGFEALLATAQAETAQEIRAIFDMSEFDIGGTMLDPHMMSRSKEYVVESRQYNSDHAWACMMAQGKIDKWLAALNQKAADE